MLAYSAVLKEHLKRIYYTRRANSTQLDYYYHCKTAGNTWINLVGYMKVCDVCYVMYTVVHSQGSVCTLTADKV
jgi:hypothetical protein